MLIDMFTLHPARVSKKKKKKKLDCKPLDFRQNDKNFLRIASAKSLSAMGASHKPADMGSCLTISHMHLLCLPSR